VKGYLVATAIWDGEPTREDVCVLLHEMEAAIFDGQTSGAWNWEGYSCSWSVSMEGRHPDPGPDTRS
jgi:hypothetical protein